MHPIRPTIDHGLLSPNGRMSKRAREAALKREATRLFPPGYWDKPVPTEREKKELEIWSLLHAAENCLKFIKSKKGPREAKKLQDRAKILQGELDATTQV